jgi:hypothetical protein
MTSNSEVEMRWINAWSDLYELVGERSSVACLLADGQVVDIETCKGWLQKSVYQGWEVKVEAGSVSGTVGVIASRWGRRSHG